MPSLIHAFFIPPFHLHYAILSKQNISQVLKSVKRSANPYCFIKLHIAFSFVMWYSTNVHTGKGLSVTEKDFSKKKKVMISGTLTPKEEA
jgi:hypothetical protein